MDKTILATVDKSNPRFQLESDSVSCLPNPAGREPPRQRLDVHVSFEPEA
jgi:hypothetical protein